MACRRHGDHSWGAYSRILGTTHAYNPKTMWSVAPSSFLARSYIRHAEASIRQSAGAVLLRLATTREAPVPSSLHDASPSAVIFSRSTSPDEESSRVACHTSARIVLWCLIRALNGHSEEPPEESSEETERTTHHRHPTAVVTAHGEKDTVFKKDKVDDLRRMRLPTEQAQNLHINVAGEKPEGLHRSLVGAESKYFNRNVVGGGLEELHVNLVGERPEKLHTSLVESEREVLHRNAVEGEAGLQPGLETKDARQDKALGKQDTECTEGPEGSKNESPPRRSSGNPMPAGNGGERFPAGAAVEENYGGGNRDVERMTSWEQHEGMLMVCEGILKTLVEERIAEIVSGNSDSRVLRTTLEMPPAGTTAGRSAPPAMAVETQSAVSTTNAVAISVSGSSYCGWPAVLVNATPPLSDLLLSLESLAENALFKAELSLSAQTIAGNGGEECATEAETLALAADFPGGSLELWRAGSQILPSIARAMVWWNPKAIRR